MAESLKNPVVIRMTDEDFAAMLEEMPTGFDQSQEPMDSTEMAPDGNHAEGGGSSSLMETTASSSTPVAGPSGINVNMPSSRRASSQGSSNFDPEDEAREEEESP